MDGNVLDPSERPSQGQIFDDAFPLYLTMGMSEEQYWDGDPQLTIFYRKADEISRDKQNSLAWLQGMYVYDAIIRLAPILVANPKKGAKPKPYTEQPYPLNSERTNPQKAEKAEKAKQDKGLAYMEAFMIANNKKYEGA